MDPDDRPTRLTDPELRELRERSARERGPFVNPGIVLAPGPKFHNREWADAVLGHPLPGSLTWPDLHVLHLAMQAEPHPPETHTQRADRERREDLARRAAAHRARHEQHAAEQQLAARSRWDQARQACPVPVEVHENTTARGRNAGQPLRHAVPQAPAVSGRARRHLAGRALCETPERHTPLRLRDAPVDLPATCVRCLAYLPKIKPAPSNNTSTEATA